MTARIAVIGAGVAGLAASLAARRAGYSPIVFEASSRAGGLVETEHAPGGLLVEQGADVLLEAKPVGMHVVHELGLTNEIVRDGPAPRRAFMATPRGLVAMPEGLGGMVPKSPMSMFGTSLLGASGKLRLLAEPFVGPGDASETVAEFADRRFGREARERLVDPMMRAIYGVTSDRLGMSSTLPHLLALEREHGSIARAMLRAPKRGGGGGLVTLRRGLGTLVDALVAAVGPERVKLDHAVTAIRRGTRGYLIDARGGTVEVDGVVLAIPAWRAAELLAKLDPELAGKLGAIEHVDVDAVSLAYSRAAVQHPLDGTGHVVADPARPATRACTWVSAKWPGRAPDGVVLFRAVLDAPDADDRELALIARRELEPLLGIEGEPSYVSVRRRKRALPVPGVGHTERRAAIAARAREHSGLALAGASEGALGVPDCLASGLRAFAAIAPRLAAAGGPRSASALSAGDG